MFGNCDYFRPLGRVLFCFAMGALAALTARGYEGHFAMVLQESSTAPAEPLPQAENTSPPPATDSGASAGPSPLSVVPNQPAPTQRLPPNARPSRRQSFGTVRLSYASAPAMLGDFFGGTFLHLATGRGTVPLAGGERRFKIAENVSPVPRDRVYFNYNHFENALRDPNGNRRSSNRFALGFEKTFFRGNASIEARLPLVRGLDSDLTVNDPDPVSGEVGNLGLAFKLRLLSGQNWILSGGSSLTLPTGDDFRYFDAPYAPNSVELLVENDAVHLSPFLGWLIQPNDRFFAQGFLQVDIDLNGNDVYVHSAFDGTIQDQNLLFLDLSMGYWFYQARDRSARLRRVAAMTELHYTGTLNDTDYVCDLGNPYNRMDVLNATAALHFQGCRNSLRIGAAAPLTDNEDRFFDVEVLLQLARSY